MGYNSQMTMHSDKFLRVQIMDGMIAKFGWTKHTAPTALLRDAIAKLDHSRDGYCHRNLTYEQMEVGVLEAGDLFIEGIKEASAQGL